MKIAHTLFAITLIAQLGWTQPTELEKFWQNLQTKTQTQLNFRENVIYAVDSVYCFATNPLSGLDFWTTREYNLEFTEGGLVLERLRQRYDTSLQIWNNELLVFNDFDDAFNLIETIEQTWDATSSDWLNKKRIERTPNGFGQNEVVLHQVWNTQTNDWQPEKRTLFTFDAAQDNILLQQQNWDTMNSVWLDVFQTFNAYNNKHQVVSTLFQIWNADQGAFLNGNRSFHTYDEATELKTSITADLWNATDQNWKTSSRTTFQYNADGYQIEQMRELWNNVDSTWIFKDRIQNAYQGDWNNETLTQNWIDTTWVDAFLTTRQFDDFGNLTHFDVFIWNMDTWRKLSSCDFFWRALTEVATRELEEPAIFCIFANPMRAEEAIWCEVPENYAEIWINVVDVNGRVVIQNKSTGINHLQLPPHTPPGLYILTVFDTTHILSRQKIIVNN